MDAYGILNKRRWGLMTNPFRIVKLSETEFIVTENDELWVKYSEFFTSEKEAQLAINRERLIREIIKRKREAVL